ncbi:GNAT family acetyltransferase [Dictyobacter alpinus]|uniref:GNAT family acetyltransferase n=1 Tax=Dictyobacter alpinus TaxID=2014873 RepID=A0A402BCK8_9CHLR|nr:GNAT family N-acetyltransferase [Dictyobacter alpinus]GCE29040.1 GNAT family acetyltransferase [Dictyobacter alpinus]
MNKILLSDHFIVRNPTLSDLEDVLELYNSFDIPKYGQPNQSLASVRTMWTAPDFALESDAWLVVAPDERLVGTMQLIKDSETNFFTSGGVHPEYRRQGIGTHLLRLASARVQERGAHLPDGSQVTMRAFCLIKPTNKAEAQLFERQGYQVVRHFWDMERELIDPTPMPVWPEGISIRTFIPGQDEHPFFEAYTQVFQDRWGYEPQTFETWAHENLLADSFDPDRCFLACHDKTIVGFALCVDFGEMGIIDQLGVQQSERKRGLGQALLHHCFGELARRGKRIAHLSVDAESLTGASRLYKRAGMHITIHNDLYQKTLDRVRG